MPTYLSPGVYVEETESGSRPIEGVGTAVASFVGLAASGPFNTPTLVTNWNQFVTTFGDFVEGTYLAHAVYAFFLNGGGSAYIVRIGANGDGKSQPTATAALAAPGKEVGPYEVKAKDSGPDGDGIEVEVSPPVGDSPPEDSFTVTVRRGDVVEAFENVTTKKGRQNVATVVNAQSELVRLVEVAGGAVDRPAEGKVTLEGGAVAPDSVKLDANDYVGDVADRTGFGGLEAVDAVTMVTVPDLMSAYEKNMIDLDGVKAVQLAMIAHCELMGDRVAIIDPPPSMNAQGIRTWRTETAGYDSNFAAMYWPWIKVFDPATGRNILTPPSGAIAGVWGRNDDSRGVHKAPANEVIRGAVSLELGITSREQELLNPHGVNCLRAFPGRGIRVWGARTLSSNPAWRYLNVRRYFNYLEESILLGTQWVVFEPNDDTLWAKIRRTIAAFLVMEWRKGALFGLTPDDAFYVKCDSETNPPEAIDAGQVLCEIGVAPVKPAEFVVFRLSQFSGGSSLNE